MIDGIDSPKILVPLCGKSVDLIWLKEQPGVTVVGVEGVVEAIEEFQTEYKQKLIRLGDDFISEDGMLKILLRNFFDANAFEGNFINCVWDRASLVAINLEDREKYVETMKHVIDTNKRFNYLLNVVEYDTTRVQGPPHSISNAEVERLFSDFFSIKKLSEKLVTPSGNDYIAQKFKDTNTDIKEVVYLLSNK